MSRSGREAAEGQGGGRGSGLLNCIIALDASNWLPTSLHPSSERLCSVRQLRAAAADALMHTGGVRTRPAPCLPRSPRPGPRRARSHTASDAEPILPFVQTPYLLRASGGGPACHSILTSLGEPTTPPEACPGLDPGWPPHAPPTMGAGGPAPGPLVGRPGTRARVRVRPAPELVAQRPLRAAHPASPTGLTARFCRAGPNRER